MNLRRISLIFAVAFLAAVIGVLASRSWFGLADPEETELHVLLHDELELDAAQRARLAEIEQYFAAERQTLENELRANNAALARAIAVEQRNGPLVEAAVDRSHRTMGALQKETLAHIFAMRGILTPDQAKEFDKVVVEALTAEQK